MVIGGAILGNIFQVAYITAVANLVDADQLTEANGRLQATLGLAFMLGPALAGLVSARFGPALAIGLDAATFAVSGLSLSGSGCGDAAARTPHPHGAVRRRSCWRGCASSGGSRCCAAWCCSTGPSPC